jgi:hypothetical protein
MHYFNSRMNSVKKLLFSIITLIISILIVEVFLGYLFWFKNSEGISTTYYAVNKIYARMHPRQDDNNSADVKKAHKIITSFSPNSPYIPDDYLGYSDSPGLYSFIFRNESTEDYHTFTANIDENGNRITSFNPEYFEGKKEIWIFGDSFTYGWGNNDETTFPFILQLYLSDFRVVNYADQGYGNVHAYLQLQRELKNNEAVPEVVVIVYGNYFNERNVAAPSRLKQFIYNDSLWKIDPSAFLHPRATLIDGNLEIEYVPLFWKFHENADENSPNMVEQHKVTKGILEEIYRIGNGVGAKMVLAFIYGENSDEVVKYSREIGYYISDIRPKDGRKEWDDFAPFDRHPGPLAQNKYAIKLHKTISEAILMH